MGVDVKTSDIYRKKIPVVMASMLMIIMAAEYYLEIEGISDLGTMMRNWGIILSSFALFLGAGMLIIFHGKHIIRRTPEKWWYGIVVITTMLSFIIIGTVFSPTGSKYTWMYSNIYSPMALAITALPVFWLASAAYRAFRVRSIDSSLMLAAGIVALLGLAPIGALIYGISPTADWIIKVPTIGATRGIIIGAGIGTFALALRVLLGREKSYLGEIE